GIYGLKQRKLRYSGAFQELLDWLEGSQWWTKDEIVEYQSTRLKKLIDHSYNTVPYYRRLFDNHKLKPADIKSPDDLYKIPVFTKEDVRKHSHDMLSRDAHIKNLVQNKTSGTTGKSLQFYLERRAVQFRWALWWRHRRRFGVRLNAKHA